jgi:hypothetical protein
VPIIWRRSSKLQRNYRIALIIFMTFAIFSLAQALNLYIAAAKLASLDSPLATRDAQHNRVGSFVAFAISLASFVAFLFLSIRGTLVAKRIRPI